MIIGMRDAVPNGAAEVKSVHYGHLPVEQATSPEGRRHRARNGGGSVIREPRGICSLPFLHA